MRRRQTHRRFYRGYPEKMHIVVYWSQRTRAALLAYAQNAKTQKRKKEGNGGMRLFRKRRTAAEAPGMSFDCGVGAAAEAASVRAHREAMARAGMTEERIRQIERSLPRDANGRYVFDGAKPLGSAENPVVVGAPDCSDTLVYDAKTGRWLLTDGLGNGWIR